MSGIYLHIPFCKQACHYCDFHFSTSQQFKEELVTALIHEIILQKGFLENTPLKTIYFGGGTPSLLSPNQIERILTAIDDNFQMACDEITLEANPDDLTHDYCEALHELGINRLSIGTQTFDDSLLQFLNRAHNENEAIKSIEIAQRFFDNISIDLIYGIHNQNASIFKKDLQLITDLCPQHISAYSLTIEGKNAFSRWQEQGKLLPPDDDLAIQHFELLTETLEANGFDQYEISNFCKEGFESKHNTSYWFGAKYLGIGPSAHSFDGKNRLYNISHNKKYIDSISSNTIPCEVDELGHEDRVNEYIMTRLRTKWGIDINELKASLDYTWNEDQTRTISSYISSKHLILNDNELVLSKSGKLIADQIASDLFIL